MRLSARFSVIVAILISLGFVVGACSASDPSPDTTTVVVATHDSWAIDDALVQQFEADTGLEVKFRPQGDAGTLTNTMVLTKDAPIADVVFGIDNTFASRAISEGILEPYTSPSAPASAANFQLPGEGADLLSPVDYGDVCLNVDLEWFAEHDQQPPTSLDDLIQPEYRGLTVLPGAATSSPGLAFLLATIGTYGDDWTDYWTQLVANDVKLTSGWSDAYEVDFSAGGGQGDRPIVLSYSSSPPFTVPEGADEPTTAALLDTCFRQVEYAGVIAGAANPEGAQQFIDFLQSEAFQTSLPEYMYVYPIDTEVELPQGWADWAPTAANPIEVAPEQIDAHRTEWIRTWRDLVAQ